MGQANSSSRRGSDSSVEPINPYNGSLEQAYETFYSASEITQPEQPRQLHRVSELIDPHELLGLTPDDLTSYPYNKVPAYPYRGKNKRLPPLVESPSGTTLGAHEFIARPNRPLAIRERQEHIRQALEKAATQERARQALETSYEGRKNSTKDRKVSKGSIWSQPSSYSSGSRKGSDSSNYSDYSDSSRKGSASSTSTVGDFEFSRIEEGRRAYESKQRKMQERRVNGSNGCFNRF